MGIFSFLFGHGPSIAGSENKRYPDREDWAKRAVHIANEAAQNGTTTLQGKCYVIDGDTIVIDNVHVRISGIDAPEIDQPWGQKAKSAVIGLCTGHIITADVTEELSHDRVVAKCTLPDGRDLAAEIVRRGLALDWPAYSGGKYRRFETADARRKLWRSARRQVPANAKASGFSAA